ncbi:MAG TPA: hypothetical protein VMZ22_07940 [Acidimicrobiales bacterium]|nr:hypothetical protein [Acidimicrobiales bacterium]
MPTQQLELAGHSVKLQFAGEALCNHVLPAMRHLVTPSSDQPDLEIRLWDLASTGVLLPPPPWVDSGFAERGNGRIYASERFTMTFERSTGIFSLVDAQRGRAVFWTTDARDLPGWSAAAPLHWLLQGWLRFHGQHVVHAGGVSKANGGVLILGGSGAGKSTTTLAAVEAGWRYAGDDFVVVQAQPPTVNSLYCAAKVGGQGLERFPWLCPAIANSAERDRGKALVFIDKCFPERLAPVFPLRAIVLARVGNTTDSRLLPADPFEVVALAGPDSAFRNFAGDARGTFAALRALATTVPTYHLELGSNLVGVVAALEAAVG